MPFTFAHPAAILPFNKRWKTRLSLTGLVLGSMAPDFEYFIHFRPISKYGHAILGFFILNLPLCFLLAYIFHYVIKRPLLLHMPSPIDKWFGGIPRRSWKLSTFKEVLIFCYSALLGMLTHVGWDSFTHVDGIMVTLLPFLAYNINVFQYSVAVYKVLQHGSSLAGIIAILACLYGLRSQNVNMRVIPPIKKLLFFIIIFLASVMLIIAMISIYMMPEYRMPFNTGTAVVTFIDCVFIGLLISSLTSRLWLQRVKT